MELKEIDKKDFNKYAEKFTCKNFFQTSNMGEYQESRNRKVYYLGLFDNEEIKALTVLSESYSFLKKKSFECLKGFLCDYQDKKLVTLFINELKDFCKKLNCYKLVIDPYIIKEERDIDGNIIEGGKNNFEVIKTLEENGFVKSKYDTQVRFNFCLDIEGKSEEDLFKDFKATTRNLINKAKREGVEIFDISFDELSEFKKFTEYTCEKRNFPDKSLEYYQKMYEVFKDKVVFKIARLNIAKYIDFLNNTKIDLEEKVSKINGANKKKENYLFEIENVNKKIDKINKIKADKEYLDLAGAMFMLYGEETIYLFSGSYDEYNEYGGQYLIQWDVLSYGIKNKYKRHNFFGILNFNDPKNKDYGIYLFKRGFNGYVEELIGQYEYVFPSVQGSIYKLKNKVR